MNTPQEALKQAREALKLAIDAMSHPNTIAVCVRSIAAIDAALMEKEIKTLTPMLTNEELKAMLPEPEASFRVNTHGLWVEEYTGTPMFTIDQMIEVMRAVERKVRGQE